MKVSLSWLQKYFAEPLPAPEVVGDALTFHAFEIEEQVGDLLDLKVLPDRGVATEVAAALNLSLTEDPLRTPLPEWMPSSSLTVRVEDATSCPRYMGALVQGVTVGPSPAWLKDALESVGQRSINNVVDATNYVMLNIGQPLHAFDAKKLQSTDGTYAIHVRASETDETITTLTGEEYTLPEGILLITDGVTKAPLGIAGVKGGNKAEVDSTTTDLIIEAANFNGPTIRRASQTLKLWTDASLRFQNSISPILVAYGMRDVLALITDIAGGTVVGVNDVFDSKITGQLSPVTVSLEKIESVLGLAIGKDEVVGALERLQLSFIEEGEKFIVTSPFERRDLTLPEDIIEEIGRTIGYDRIPSTTLPALPTEPDQARFYGIERIKDFLSEREFVELSTQSFAANGEILLKNPLQLDRPWLRASLLQNLEEDALKQVVNVAMLPGILKYSIGLSDMHVGYGFPIGGVAAFDLDSGVISPGGVGYDIDCSVRLLKTNLKFEDIKNKKELIHSLFRAVPSGVGRGSNVKLNWQELDEVLKNGAKWAVEKGYGIKTISL